MSILGGFQALVYTSATKTGSATNIGLATRINPLIDPNLIEGRGTGSRDLYDLLLGVIDPQIALDLTPTSKTFIATYQDGQTAIPWLHLKTSTYGLTLQNVYVNRLALESRVGEALALTLELWPEAGETLASASWGAAVTTPYRWLNSVLSIGGVPETEWHSWRYEVINNLQRLANVSSGGTRSIKARTRAVTGTIIKDLTDYAEFVALLNIGSPPNKFNITIALDGTELLNSNCRWERIEAPAGPEDLILKRFPFRALSLT